MPPATSVKANKRHRDRPFLWFALVGLAVLGWPLLDGVSAPPQPVDGVVTGFQPVKWNSVDIVIEFADGEIVRKTSSEVLPNGTRVPCMRYTRRLSGARYYEC